MSCQDSDCTLVRRIAAGDEEALRALYAAYGQRLYAYALRITGDPFTAEDALQDTLVAVWRGASRFRAEGRVIAWLLGIVHRKGLNALRGRPHAALDAEDAPEPAATDPALDEQAAASEQGRLLRAELARLPLEQRTALELVFYQGLTLAEVAEVCGCPVGTVKSRLSYAKARLRGLLNRSGLRAEDIA